MMALEKFRAASFELTTAAQRFVLEVLPFRGTESRSALARLAQFVRQCRLPRAALDRILVECLSILDRHTGGRIPTLVETYLASTDPRDSGKSFEHCVENLLRYRGVDDQAVQRVISALHDRHADPSFTEASAASDVGLTAAGLSARFRAKTGHTFEEYRREVRLDRAATLLATTGLSIKQVWATAGYNYASNFDHDFKRRYRISPSAYRKRVIQAAALVTYPAQSQHRTNSVDAAGGSPSNRHGPVLIVDDDETLCYTTASYLRQRGYTVGTALSGEEALQVTSRVTPQVILLDFHLQDMDGVRFVRLLNERNAMRPRRLVILTADWWLDTASEELRALDASFAWKPCDLETVEALIAAPLAAAS